MPDGPEAGVARRGAAAAAGIFAASRVVCLAAAWLASRMPPNQPLREILGKWDGGWYLKVADVGYPSEVPASGASTHAFVPGYPLLIRAVRTLTGLSTFRAALVVSLLTGLLAMVLLWLLMERVTGSGAAADRTVALVCFFPWAFVFSMTYSEGLLLAAVCACLLWLLSERWVLAGLAAAVAGVCRPNGFVLFVPCAWAAWQALRAGWGAGSGSGSGLRLRRLLPLAAPALAPVGILAFFVFLQVRAGDFLANVHVKDQAMGGQGIGLDFSSVAPHWRAFVAHPEADLNFVTTFVSLGIVAAAGVAAWRGWGWRPPLLLWLYAGPVLFLAFWFTSFGSTLRFVMTAFPVLAVFSVRMKGSAFAVLLASSAVLMGVLTAVVGKTILLTP